MGRSLLYCLSGLLVLTACNQTELDPEKSEAELGKSWHYYQGSVENMAFLQKAVELDSNNGEAWRELSIPYLKRGYPQEWYPLSAKAIQLEPFWIAYRGTNYLFFYRDYERALSDFRTANARTPGVTTAAQGMSIKYLKALCFYGMGKYDSAMANLQSYIDEESANFGPGWVDQNAYLYKTILQNKLGQPEQALLTIEMGLKVFDQYADLYFQRAIALHSLGYSDSAKTELTKSMEYFELGYYNRHDYVELPDQLYEWRFEELLAQITDS